VLYLAGNFSQLGTSSAGCLARITIGDGVLDLTWNAPVRGAFGGTVRALLASDELVVGGSFNSICGLSRTNLAQISFSAPALPDPEWTPNPIGLPTAYDWQGVEVGGVDCLAADGDALYVGGTFTSVAGFAQANIAKVATTGYAAVETSWSVNTAGG